jgi:transcription-repair coupling factor (superfamily II helicase)
MDRLVCGDVGFGKTEVAVRAAFKAVMDGKQVAVLVPTTILAEQHLGTFIDRFSLYPVRVDMLSRFKTHSEQKQIIENLKKGAIDVVIGTHRLIQKDIMFKDLGLVIVDEEQRFGVEHKERLKQLRKMVDVITMTATPIPRTLYMSMTKIRDMSIIETPPRDRIPIETFVLEYNEEIVIQAVSREIERGGQVYYVHNRVRTIEEKTESLKRILPGVSIEIAHGRMEERDLEEIMKDFFDMEFQVLVTTTIIESGLDIPNVNTIIIERADRFGLSQLYQLRGRVGRSKRKAYAYLFYPTGKVMTEQAQKRLTVINDHTELGAGYSIAMKDLEIRGAGNILGRDQHGDMLTVGFEMYVKLLDEAIQELRSGPEREVSRDTAVGQGGLQPAEETHGTVQSPAVSPVVDVKYSGFVPKTYIDSEKLRIEVYRRLSGVRTTYDLNELKDELNDRFGLLPNELLELFYFARLKVLCIEVGIKSLREKEDELVLVFEKSRVDILQLIQKINKNRRLFGISPKDYNTLHVYRTFEDNILKLEFLKDLFDYEEDT